MSAELDRTVHRTGARTDGIDFVMVGLRRPAGGVRIYATRHMPHLEWGQVQRGYATMWHIEADMDNLLVIDKPDYPQALARLFELWAAQDAAKAGTGRLEAVPGGRAPAVAALPDGTRAITRDPDREHDAQCRCFSPEHHPCREMTPENVAAYELQRLEYTETHGLLSPDRQARLAELRAAARRRNRKMRS